MLPIFRLPLDAYLMYAECVEVQVEVATATTYINALRTRGPSVTQGS
jgi:hypothetical protein